MVLLIRVPLAVVKGTVMATGKLLFAAYVPVAVSGTAQHSYCHSAYRPGIYCISRTQLRRQAVIALAEFVFVTSTSTAELTVKLVAVVLRTMPAEIAPKADTLPNARVAVFVPAPESATPEASELKTRLMLPVTVAVTVSVPLAVVCATAAEEIIISAAKMVKSNTFFIVVPLLISNSKVHYFKKAILQKTQLAVAVKLIVVVIGVFTAGPPAPGAAVKITKSRLCATSVS